jgi:hypothetical protein
VFMVKGFVRHTPSTVVWMIACHEVASNYIGNPLVKRAGEGSFARSYPLSLRSVDYQLPSP